MRWAQRQQFPMQSLSKTVFKPDIVTFFEKANLHHPTNKFATEIRWDNIFRHNCIQRYKIQRKSYPWCTETTETFQHTFRPLSPTDLSKEFAKCFTFQKNAWWTEATNREHNLKEKLPSEINETHRNWSPRSWNKTARKKKKCCLSWHNTSPQCLL